MKSYPKIDVLGEVIKSGGYGQLQSAKLRIGDQYEAGLYSVKHCPKCGKFYDKFGKYEHFTTTGVDKIICRWCIAGVEYVPEKPRTYKKRIEKPKKIIEDLTGRRFGFWDVLRSGSDYKYVAKCKCGLVKEVSRYLLLTNTSRACHKCKAELKKNQSINQTKPTL